MKTSLRICALLAVMLTLSACSGQEPDIKTGVKNAFEKVKTYGQTLVSGANESAKATPADAVEGDKIAVVFDSGVNFEDHSFNQMAAIGAKQAASELKTKVDMLTVPQDKSREGFYRLLIEEGYTHIIGIGYQNVLPVIELAVDNPDTKFTVIDGLAPPSLPNVRSIRFKDNEGSFLVGMVAAAYSKTGKIGFVGALDIPLIQDFGGGYEQGARYMNPSIQVVKQTLVTDKNPWNDPETAQKSAEQIIDYGADVIYAAAGASGAGAMKAAVSKGKFAIGVDFNQNGEYPGKVLTSMVKRLDVAVYDDIKQDVEDKWQPGKVELGLKEGGVDYVIDDNNKSLISEDLKNKIEQARQGIVSGKLKVFSFREKAESSAETAPLPESLPEQNAKTKEGAN